MRKFHEFVKWTLYITTGILIVCASNVLLMGEEQIPAEMLWQILLAGALTSFVTVVFFPRECEEKIGTILQFALHYAVLCVVMIICGSMFGWMNLNAAGVIMMLISVAVVYLLSFLAYYIIDMRQADAINQKLKERYGDK